MSLSWPDGRIAILPGRVAVATRRGVTELAVPADRPDGLARTLTEALAAARCRGRVDLVLSHALAPVWLLPSPALRLNWSETRAWLREKLAAQLGERPCRLAFQPAAPGEPLLVGALDDAWLAGLVTALAGQGVRPHSVQPWLASAWNRHRAKLRRGGHWLALAEPGRLTLACFQAGRPRAVRSLPAAGDPAALLADGVRREGLLAGLPDGLPVWLESAGVVADWRVTRLDVRPLAGARSLAATLIGS